MSRAFDEQAASVVSPPHVEAAVARMRELVLQPGRPTCRERLAALEGLSDALLAGKLAPHEAIGPIGVPFLATFLRRSHLEALLAREIPVEALDQFAPWGDRSSLRLGPRGVVCHWMAGNVPLLGMFSLAVSMAVGNGNIVRISRRQDDFLSPLLALLRAGSDIGRQLADETLVVEIDRDDRDSQAGMSAVADVRVVWGGQEAVEAVVSLPHSWDCDTIVLGPRTSLAVIDPAEMTEGHIRRLATDIVYFDQLACSSPQVVFAKGQAGQEPFDRFFSGFVSSFSSQALTIQRHTLDEAETYRIVLDRARLALSGAHVQSDRDTQWTVALVQRPDARVAGQNRVIQVVPFADVEDVYDFIPKNIQTVVICLNRPDTERFSEAAALRGACRLPRPGQGNHFETPWDGIPLAARLTRWIVRTNQPLSPGPHLG